MIKHRHDDIIRRVTKIGTFTCCWTSRRIDDNVDETNNSSKYYFAYGSNMLPSTMISLRHIQQPISVSAALLPYYELYFPAPDAACVKKISSSLSDTNNTNVELSSSVHGVLYQLSQYDFQTIEQTEGPFYSWEQCHVYPYHGNNDNAGMKAFYDKTSQPISCYTLVINRKTNYNPQILKQHCHDIHIPPSQSYLQILQQGASYWKLDRIYQMNLFKTISSKHSIGFSGLLLQWLEFINPPYQSIKDYY
jgi:Gamma-glutamyl cyclotransferase, AIG2-like